MHDKWSHQNYVRSVLEGKELRMDDEQQRKGLAPSQLSSARLLPNAVDDI